MEGCGFGGAGCVVHVECACIESKLCCGLLYNAIATEHSRYGLFCMHKLWPECTSSDESVWHVIVSSHVMKLYWC